MKATLLVHHEEILLNGKYVVTVTVYSVDQSKKFPDGIKAKFLLQTEEGIAKLLIDNHQPYGFHMHTQLPHNHSHREILDVKDYQEAMDFFFEEVGRIVKNEEA